MVPVMLKLIALLTILSTAACTTEDGETGDEGLAETGAIEGAIDTTPTSERTQTARGVSGDDLCAHLPTEGPCSLACDPEAMIEQYVPAGTCVLFGCTLDTGETYNTGGCND